MRISSKMLWRVLKNIAILGLFLGVVIYPFWRWFRSDSAITTTLGRQFSPDSHWEAILEEVDNGLGFGLGALFQAIYIHKRNTSIEKHPSGDSDDAIVFYIASEEIETMVPKFHWVDSNHLIIDYLNKHHPGKKINHFKNVYIEYRVFDAVSEWLISEPWSDSETKIYLQHGPILFSGAR